MTILIDAAGVLVSRADRTLFSDLSVTVTDKDRLGVVGINGTGKSTLLRVLAGSELPERGVVRRGRGARVAMLDQDAELPMGTVQEVVGDGWESASILDRLGMSAYLDRQIHSLSGGQAKRVALAMVLARPAELLILDEPTNHLDLGAISWLEAWLAGFSGGLVVVSHDRYLLDAVTSKMLELDRGAAFVHDGGYASYLDATSERATRTADAEGVRRNLARRELAWLRRGAKARSRKPQARVDAARRLINTTVEPPARSGVLDLGYETPRLGGKVIEMEGVTFGYEENSAPVLVDVSLSLAPRERLGVVGENGSAKSTLLELMAGERSPWSGSIERGTTVRIGHYRQEGPEFELTSRVREVVAGPHGNPEDLAVKRLLDRFWFTGELPWATIGTLSGGERRRVQLLMVLAARPNVLLLDEPTNDLDLDTLRALEEFLEEFPGAVVTVSHDRAFLDRVTERIVACRGQRVDEVAGGLAAWIAAETAKSSDRSLAPTVSPTPKRTPRSAREETHPEPALSKPRSGSTVGFQLRLLDKELSRIAKERDRLQALFESTTDHRLLAEIGEELAAIYRELASSEEAWLALAEEAENSR